MSSAKQCGRCTLRNQVTGVCQVFNKPVENSDSCPAYSSVSFTCETCGQTTLNPIVCTQEGSEKYYLVCDHCAPQLNGCAICTCETCEFQTNPSPTPMYVMQQVRQGNAIMQTQVRNPERVKITCEAGCKCYDAVERTCNRESGCCKEFRNKLFT